MALLTAADLIESLRREGESYEALAARLPISLSTVNRWKRESPRDWDAIMEMLELGGWLKRPDAETASPSQRREAVDPRLVAAAEQLADLAATLDGLVSEQEPQTTAAPTRRAGRGTGSA